MRIVRNVREGWRGVNPRRAAGRAPALRASWLALGGDATLPPMFDVSEVRALLIAAAREGRAVSYVEGLAAFGHRFTRPKMRAFCKALDAVDQAGAAAGEPELAVLVVRESDGLPGQGWWVGSSLRYGHEGDWTGPEAKALVRELQGRAFDYWRDE
ncbi:ribose-phosphate pyrophosphokinase [Sphingomonas sp.]|uniref:ribose-phosphate pyrophosphokinase n=1 Tax=Sphingomonas sp. TaxID=28214 RepID=UPI002E15BF34